MVNSPDRLTVQTTLEEFMEQYVEGKELGLDEEDVRNQLAVRYGMGLREFTQMLYGQGIEEQRKGTKGLTKFLAKWRRQLAADTPQGSMASSWSLVGTPQTEGSTPEKSREEVQSVPTDLIAEQPIKQLAVLPPPGIYGQEDRKAGTGGGVEPMAELARAIQQQTSELATLVKAQHETTTAPSGSMKALGKMSEELVFLLRACGQYTVEIGDGEYGSNLAQALLSAQASASTKLRSAGFRQKVTTRLAIGIAGPFWGTQETYALSAADFVACSDAELDNFALESRTGKAIKEQRPAMPTRIEEWLNRVKRQNDIWALVFGKEWKPVRDHAADLLGSWHTQAPHKCPLQVIIDVWEELHWKFVEELKAELRKIKALSGRETMQFTDLKFYALMPDDQGKPPLQLPRTFDLNHPDGWFATEVLPRIERRQERLLWKLTWEGATKQRGTNVAAGGTNAQGGGDPALSLKSLLEPKMTAEETNRAKDRAPTAADGRLLCWGYLTHLGCAQSNCQRAHENLKGTFESLDPAVRMQLLRRGGLRRMKLESKESATEKIKELRANVARDKAAKVQDGQDRRRAGNDRQGNVVAEKKPEEDSGTAGGVTWKAPIEMEHTDFTPQEADFAQLVAGPDPKVLEHIKITSRPHEGRQGETAPPEAQRLLQEAQRLADGPVLSALQDASDDLYAWASTRVANEPSVTLVELLGEMNQFGLGELAAEAAQFLEKTNEGKAGQGRRCNIGATHWEGDGPGRAQVDIDGTCWAMYDFKEQVQMTEELAGLVGAVHPEVEKRQGVTKVLAAGCLMARDEKVPSMKAVEEFAQVLRLEQARLAADAESMMGHAEPKVTPIEHELRMYTHDILKPHHDKDYRAVAAFPVEAMGNVRLIVLRVDYKGDVLTEVIQGTQWRAGQPDMWALIWKGHMTLLVPPDRQAALRWLHQQDAYTTPCLGFHYFWHQRHDQPRTASGTLVCRHCKPPRRAGEYQYEWFVRKETCLPALALYTAGGTGEKFRVTPCTTTGGPSRLVLKEFFAGHGVISSGWRDAGEVALEEVELYQDPHRRTGRRDSHDLSKAVVQAQMLKEVDSDLFNVEWIACPCTTYCDWNLENGGTRTFQQPMGEPTEKEAMGNTLSTFGATLFERALRRGHFPIAESSGLSGRYPKQWHLPAWQRILQRPDVDFLEVDMCGYGLAPADQPDGRHFYRHRTGLAFPRHAGFRAALFRLCPGLSHDHHHVPLKGARPGADVTRCTEAGVYAPQFVQAVVQALQSLLMVGGEGPSISPQIKAGGVIQSRGEGERQGPGPDDGASSSDQASECEGEESELQESDSALEEERPNGSPNSPTGSSNSEEEDRWWVQDGMLWVEHRRPRRFAMLPTGDWSPYFPAEFRRERFTMFYRAFEPRDEEDAWQIMDDWRAQGECEGPFQWWVGTTVFLFRDTDLPAQFPFDMPSGAQQEDRDDGAEGGGSTEENGNGGPSSSVVCWVPVAESAGPSDEERRGGGVGGAGEERADRGSVQRDCECPHRDDAFHGSSGRCLRGQECHHPDDAVPCDSGEGDGDSECYHADDVDLGGCDLCLRDQECLRTDDAVLCGLGGNDPDVECRHAGSADPGGGCRCRGVQECLNPVDAAQCDRRGDDRDFECHHADGENPSGCRICLSVQECLHPVDAVRCGFEEDDPDPECHHADDAGRGGRRLCHSDQECLHVDDAAQCGFGGRALDYGGLQSGGVEQDGSEQHHCHQTEAGTDESRVAGASCWTDFLEEGFGPDVEQAAYGYVRVINEIEDAEAETWRKVCAAGDHLLKCAGGVEEAAKALWIAREKLDQNNLRGIDDADLDGLLHEDWLAYLRDIRAQGMPARYVGERSRVRTRPHPRARANMPQVYQQLMKDVSKHRVLVVNHRHPGLGHAVSSPFEAVPKMLPNRTLSSEVRLVHDQRLVNAGTDKELHPPAVQPLHQQIVRRILWLKAMYPGIKVVMAKKDVAGAFRLLWVDPRDVELFGGDLPWEPESMGSGKERARVGDPPGLTLLYLVSSFGFSGSPGEWTLWGRATEELHRSHAPADTRRDGTINFDGKILVDDMVLVEPCIGLRPWISAETYQWAVVKLLGDKAVNAAKDAEEGIYGPEQLVWGVAINTETERMALPEARVMKGAYLLQGSEYSFGEKTLTLKGLQRFRGIATGWATIVGGLKNELKAADVFLSGVDGAAVIQPRGPEGDPTREAQAWEDLWDLFEDCRWLCARSETWAEKFGGDIREVLMPMERLAMPGQLQQVVFVSSDATLDVLAAIDWTHGEVCREELEQLKPWIWRVVESESADTDQKLAIHLGEMLSFVAFACKMGPKWVGKIVVYGGDNKVVYHWINGRKSNVRAGRLLVRVLNMVEMRYRCRILGGW